MGKILINSIKPDYVYLYVRLIDGLLFNIKWAVFQLIFMKSLQKTTRVGKIVALGYGHKFRCPWKKKIVLERK